MNKSDEGTEGYWAKRAKYYESFHISSKNRISDVNWTDMEAKMDNYTKSRELLEKKAKSRAEKAKKLSKSPLGKVIKEVKYPIYDAFVEEMAEKGKSKKNKVLRARASGKLLPPKPDTEPEPNAAFRYKKRRSFFHDQADKVSESQGKYSVEAPTEEEEDMLDEDMNLS